MDDEVHPGTGEDLLIHIAGVRSPHDHGATRFFGLTGDPHGLVVAGGVGGDAHEIVMGIVGPCAGITKVPDLNLIPFPLQIGPEIEEPHRGKVKSYCPETSDIGRVCQQDFYH
jgi:hypothetical protein